MFRFASALLLALLPACTQVKIDRAEKAETVERGYAGTVQKVFPVTRQGEEVPGIRLLGQVGNVIGPALRQSSETHQYVVRTATGQIMAQSDEEFFVGDCVVVVPEDDAPAGPAFRYGQARILKSDKCTI
jgi:hypothetical protein